MPHYFFHLRTTDGIERDDEGMTFPCLDEARADAISCLFEMASDEFSAGRQTKLLGIDITDGQRTVLASVQLGDENENQVEAKDTNEGHAFIHGRGGGEKP
jgi:hypothetical protein